MNTESDSLVLYGVDFSHARLLDLTKLANQAEPFYRWVETKLQKQEHSGDALKDLLFACDLNSIYAWIVACYEEKNLANVPKLFDGGGIPYEHDKACYLFFSWLARDAATQRLRPLLQQARRNSGLKSVREIEIEALSRLIHNYRDNLQYFDWPVIREVTLQRLEGSRRAKKGSAAEIYVRTALAQSFAYYQKTRGNYGLYVDFEISSTPLKIDRRTYDVVALLKRDDDTTRLLVLPVKTRETQGGGHAHLFTRDIEQANQDILAHYPDAVIASVIIAQNWSSNELDRQKHLHGAIFHFPVAPTQFRGFDRANQQALNILVEEVLDGNL